jgi:hypothetical protein
MDSGVVDKAPRRRPGLRHVGRFGPRFGRAHIEEHERGGRTQLLEHGQPLLFKDVSDEGQEPR